MKIRQTMLLLAAAALVLFVACKQAPRKEGYRPPEDRLTGRLISLAVVQPLPGEASESTSLLAGTSTGAFLSTDGGNAWKQFGITRDKAVTNVAGGLPGVIYIVTSVNSESQLLRSTNSGRTWEESATGALKGRIINALGSDDTGQLVVGTNNGLVLQNHRGVWAILTLEGKSVSALTLDRPEGVMVAATDNGVYESRDRGVSWLNVGLFRKSIESVLRRDGVLFAVCDREGVYSRTDGKWNKVLDEPAAQAIAAADNGIFVGTVLRGVYGTPNKGLSWSKFLEYSDLSVVAMDATDKVVYVGAFDGTIMVIK